MNRIIQRIAIEKPQSILLTGESGSGKTKSARHILSFFGYSSLSDHTKERFSNANTIFELFGNATTSYNKNSSRFTKLTEANIQKFCFQTSNFELTYLFFQIYLNSDLTLASVQFSYLLLESHRVYARNDDETNFHILHSLIFATENCLENYEDLKLDITTNYKVKYVLNILSKIKMTKISEKCNLECVCQIKENCVWKLFVELKSIFNIFDQPIFLTCCSMKIVCNSEVTNGLDLLCIKKTPYVR